MTMADKPKGKPCEQNPPVRICKGEAESAVMPGRGFLQCRKGARKTLWLVCVAFMVTMAVPLAYRVLIHFWPPEAKPRQASADCSEEVQRTRCMKLLAKPIVEWSDAEMKLEPGIYAWLKEQGNEILPWEWTEEARRKDPKGYAKCWRRIWNERKSWCKRLLAECEEETKRLDRELQILTTIYVHRTNQIARLSALVATNTFPCQISLERLKKGRLWGWNKVVEVVECKDAAEMTAATNRIYGIEAAAAAGEVRRAKALSDSITSAKEKSVLYEKLREICDQSISLIDNELQPGQHELLLKSLVEVLKGGQIGQ